MLNKKKPLRKPQRLFLPSTRQRSLAGHQDNQNW